MFQVCSKYTHHTLIKCYPNFEDTQFITSLFVYRIFLINENEIDEIWLRGSWDERGVPISYNVLPTDVNSGLLLSNVSFDKPEPSGHILVPHVFFVYNNNSYQMDVAHLRKWWMNLT